MNSSIGRALERGNTLQRENAALSIENSEMAAGDRVETRAAHLGMEIVPSGSLHFLAASARADIAHAAAALAKPLSANGEPSSAAASSTGSGEASSASHTGASGEAEQSSASSPSSSTSATAPTGETAAAPSSEAAPAAGRSEAQPAPAPSTSTPAAGAAGSGEAGPGGGTQPGPTG